MSSTLELVVRSIGLAVFVAVVLTARWARAGRGRWGVVRARSQVAGDGAYRRGLLTEHRPRRTPASVWLVAGLGTFWGILTTMLFAPGGLVFLLAPVQQHSTTQMLLAISALGAWGSSISGFPLGVSLIATAHALLVREDDLAERAIPIAAWSTIHHACVWVAFTFFAIHQRDASIAIAISIPCAIGIAHAWALGRIVRRLPSFATDGGDDATLP